MHAASRRSYWSRIGQVWLGILFLYLITAYVLLPFEWERYVTHHRALNNIPQITYTGNRIPGDPLNVALIGSEDAVKKIMVLAKWYPADPLTLKSCLGIAEATVLKRPYDAAPVSNLYMFGRKEDLAFEQPVNNNPRKRHHVRFWLCPNKSASGEPVWVGSGSFDDSVGLSHTTGQITHHISSAVDEERDHILSDLQATGDLTSTSTMHNFHTVTTGKNGGGDPWHTDGDLRVGVINPAVLARPRVSAKP